jgi:transposase
VYWGFESPLLTGEGFRIAWIRSSQKAERDIVSRQRRLARASDELTVLAARLESPRTRKREAQAVRQEAQAILARTQTTELLNVAVEVKEQESFQQAGPGRPSQKTAYIRKTKHKLVLHWSPKVEAQRLDAKMDGIFPLVTNDKRLSVAEVLTAYKHQPSLERRHEQLKTVLEVMPMYLKSSTRVEALLFLYFVAVLVHSLIERHLRKAMAAQGLEELPLYPEERACRRPTAEQVFRLFDDMRCHRLLNQAGPQHTFRDELSDRQCLILKLLGVAPASYFAGCDAST